MSVPFCPIQFCPYTILSIPFCPYHFVHTILSGHRFEDWNKWHWMQWKAVTGPHSLFDIIAIYSCFRECVLHLGTADVCSLEKYYYCLTNVAKLFISSNEASKCDCPLQCYQPSYPFSVSTSPLSQHFLNYMSQHAQVKGRNLTMAQLRNGLVYIDIFYSDLNYIDIQTTPAYDFLELVCDCSGALGLILGGTLLTIVEFVQFFIQLLNELGTSARFARMQRC